MAAIRSIETAVPDATAEQGGLRDLLLGQPGYGRLGRRLLPAAFDNSGIETRHVVIDEFATGEAGQHPEFFAASATGATGETGTILDPGTRVRNDAYTAEAPRLLLDAARRAIASAPGVTEADVTHVVTVSCTGFFAPGPDFVLVRDLGLAPSTQRFHLGFMGCCAAFPALRIAEQFVRADPAAVVLVVTVELCSLHVHIDDDPDQIVAASVFADGAAAAIVTATPEPGDGAFLELDAFQTGIVPSSEAEMAWTIGDHGFDMTLSSYVPRVVGQSIRSALQPLLQGSVPARWAIHPGGRSILDRVQQALALTDDDLAASRDVLRRFGNMSSATVLFVLRELVVSEATGPEEVCAVAFGPGLTVEAARLTLHPATQRALGDARSASPRPAALEPSATAAGSAAAGSAAAGPADAAAATSTEPAATSA